MNITTFFENLIAMYCENLLWYAGFAFPFFFIFWIVGKKYFKKIRIQETERASLHHFKHDLGFSASTFLIFAIMDVCFLYLGSADKVRPSMSLNFDILFQKDIYQLYSRKK